MSAIFLAVRPGSLLLSAAAGSGGPARAGTPRSAALTRATAPSANLLTRRAGANEPLGLRQAQQLLRHQVPRRVRIAHCCGWPEWK